jgi:hypothetical protein
MVATFETRAEKLLGFVYRGIHHAPDIKKFSGRWEINHHGQLSTFDFDELTRLVISAHDLCIRASVAASGPGMVKIMLHDRKTREGRMYDRHPTIEQAIQGMPDRMSV